MVSLLWLHPFAFLNRILKPNEEEIHMNVLIEICTKDPNHLGFIQDSWLNPSNTMELSPSLNLTSIIDRSAGGTQVFLSETVFTEKEIKQAADIALYFKQIRKIHHCFMDLKISNQTALTTPYGKAKPEDNLSEDNLMSQINNWNMILGSLLSKQPSMFV
jgi:hypothetical protein